MCVCVWQVEKALDSMGFMAEEAEQPVLSFSGGWKMRIGLGKILLQDPNILLLDEPTVKNTRAHSP